MKNFNFGNYICKMREKKGLTQSQLGEKLGVTNKAVSRWENGGAYPSTELMLPLAKELGVTIEDLYKVISEDKSPKTKSRILLEYLVHHNKIFTILCLALTVIPYILFVCFSNTEDKMSLALATPIVCLFAYAMVYLMFVLMRKNPFASGKAIDIYTIIFLVIMCIGNISLLSEYLLYFPNKFNIGLGFMPVVILSVIHSIKSKYK